MHLAARYIPQVKLAPLSILRSMMPSINGLNYIATSKNIPIGGPQLIEKAKMIADVLGKSDFKGSQGWLEKWEEICCQAVEDLW